MTVCQLRISDGRDCHEEALRSLEENLPVPDAVVEIDDSGHSLGFAGAVQEGWRQVLETGCEFVWHAELDFLYAEWVPLQRMVVNLARNPYLTQMSLLRQAVNDEERMAGGIYEAYPEQFYEVHKGADAMDVWVETMRFGFTTNPSLYRSELCERGWPDPPESEGKFGAYLLRDRPEMRAGIWGRKDDAPRVEHIGVRVGAGY